ncbi:MAG: threonine/serine exporter family protein [Acidaminococcus sp.]|jgi:uncharacterized membrane protein YjjB (DUF3815 family)|nr:threonine/serine exporter family protein [Acidaminococcus sp.]MCI2115440.1 threonine/serine exporter family protein [Acidaminococcus sp.]MCI2117538.1 threonine/serine exporter family protein [Acidaminococcus sp.]
MSVLFSIIVKTICSFFGTVAFGKIFNCPKKCLWQAGFVGAVGFGVYIVLLSGFGVSSMLSNFAGTVALSICSEVFARKYRQPVPVFSIPGVIPLVPGLPLYRAMNYTMLNGYSMGMHTFVSAALDATAIAMGILLVSGLAKVYKTSKALVSKAASHGIHIGRL